MAVTQEDVTSEKADELFDNMGSGILPGTRKWQTYRMWYCLAGNWVSVEKLEHV